MDEESLKIIEEYISKFMEAPPLPYGSEYDDEDYLEIVKKAIERGEALTLDDFDSIQERVILE